MLPGLRIDHRVITKGNVTKIQPYHTHFLIVVKVFQKKYFHAVFYVSVTVLFLLLSLIMVDMISYNFF